MAAAAAATMLLARADSAIMRTKRDATNVSIAEIDAPTTTYPHRDHPIALREPIAKAVDEYVLQNWDFEGDEACRRRFLSSGVGSLAFEYFPSALEERIGLVARHLAVVFLISDSLSEYEAEDGEEYVEALEAAAKGYWMPDEEVPAVWMLCSLFDEMRTIDYVLVDDVMETTLGHLRACLFRRGRTTNRGDGRRSPGFRIGAALVSSLSSFATGMEADGW
ncbi:Hypothetical predicted protein [Lecanosticta acicola]|uniref:Uncharacterized protein n=1 Tax=Lecanosticta acicola TaxID=111012 RepID=A0AAI8YRT6_9PEZI|nr:Hypothetical predicted protein [Lecanosticta acicola]